ncbi:hypothetical protein LCGC14_1692220 [marine sediment metagenome]|uniref:AAA+ ATPase domain-containing protein n=1 Tax=marine sediment metagenome TaxID=412755 RepID=A0A0F9I824_9ZZZZ
MAEAQRRYYRRQKAAKEALGRLKFENPEKYQALLARVNDGESVVKVVEGHGGPVRGAGHKPTSQEHQDADRAVKVERRLAQVESAQENLAQDNANLHDSQVEMNKELSSALDEIEEGAQKAARAAAVLAVREVAPTETVLTVRSDAGIHVLQGHHHNKLELLIQVANQKLHVFMVGPAGGGKTTAAGQVAEALGLPFFEASMGPATSQWDLMGFRSPNGKYIPGILREPYEKGGVLALDELDNSNPSVLTALNSALSNHQATFPDTRIKRHPNFICLAAGNTYGRGADRLYVGRNQLDAATLDRFVVITWDYDEKAEVAWAGTDQLSWTQYIQRVRHVAWEHRMRVVISPRASIFGAQLLRAGIHRDVVAELTLWKGMTEDDRAKLQSEVNYA